MKHLRCNWKFPSGPMVRPLAAGQLPPDWYDVYNSNIYGSGKIDINCIANIVRNDLRLKSVLQGKNFKEAVTLSHPWQTMMKTGPFCRDQISTVGLSFTESLHLISAFSHPRSSKTRVVSSKGVLRPLQTPLSPHTPTNTLGILGSEIGVPSRLAPTSHAIRPT